MTLTYPGLFACSILLTAVPAWSASVFTDPLLFNAELAPGAYTDPFTSPPDAIFSMNGFSYEASVSAGSVYLLGGVIGTFQPGETFIITFTSDNVTAVGGNFFISSDADAFIPAELGVTLSDGTVDTWTPASVAEFRGYITSSEGPFITSLVIAAPASDQYINVDNLTVGAAVPEPTTGLLAGAALVALPFRRRRR